MSNKPQRHTQQQSQQLSRVEYKKTETSVNFSPLPPAEELQHLEQIHPGIVERIIQMAEKEQNARHDHTRELLEIEKKSLLSLNFNIRLGLLLGFASVFLSTGMCGYFAYLGNIEAAADAAKWVIVSLAAVFITGRYLQNKRAKE